MEQFDRTTCDRLISLAFEIEGLAMLLRERAESIPPEACTLLREKIAAMGALASCKEEDKPDAIAEVQAETEQIEDIARTECENAGQEVAAAAEFEQKADADIQEIPLVEIPDRQDERLDERFARESARDIRHAFTLNDRFRFRRELFSNSEPRLAEAIEVVASMNSLEEAEDYFYNDLVWDRDSDDVKDFMAIVARHFDNVR